MARRTRDLAGPLVLTLALAVGQALGADPAGSWFGSWTLPEHPSHALHVTVQQDHDGTWAGTLSSPSGGLETQPMQSLRVHGSTLTFTVMGGFDFRGTLDEDGHSMAGIVRAAGIDRPGVFHLDRRADLSGQPDTIVYGGDISLPHQDYLSVTIHLSGDEGVVDATVTLPSLGLRQFPIRLRREGGYCFVRLESLGLPEDLLLVFEPGAPVVDALCNGKSGRTRVTLHRDRLEHAPRPQTPPASGPWVDQPLTLESEGEPTLRASFMHPETPGPWPVIMLLGDVGTDVNGTSFGHPTTQVLAVEAARRGIATLRTASRGDAGLRSRQRDARRWYDAMISRDDVDPNRVAIIGHGDGGAAAARLAPTRDGDLAMLVLLGSPGLPGRELAPVRLRHVLSAAGADPEVVDRAVEARRELINLSLDDMNLQARQLMARRWLEAQAQVLGTPSAQVEADVQRAVAALDDADTRYRMAFDPRETLARMRGTPILAIHGGLDLEVEADANLDAIEQAVGHRGGSVEAIRMDSLNHLLQPARTGEPSEYGDIRMTLSPEVMSLVFDRIEAEFSARPVEVGP